MSVLLDETPLTSTHMEAETREIRLAHGGLVTFSRSMTTTELSLTSNLTINRTCQVMTWHQSVPFSRFLLVMDVTANLHYQHFQKRMLTGSVIAAAKESDLQPCHHMCNIYFAVEWFIS